MKNIKIKRALLCGTVLSGVAGAVSTPALAQDDDDADDVIIVTGSRLSQANLSSSSPVFQVDAGEIDTRGVTRVEDLVNILPQAFASQTSELANGATGTSSLNLRGLGSIRTLVLIDGKRLPFGSPLTSAANLDIIPAQLVERVDVVTGGASAVYGSDALAGVANFILRRDFEGIMFDGQVGFYQDGNSNEFANQLLDVNGIERPGSVLDGREVNATITIGANTADGRGNVTAFFGYSDQNEVRQGERDYSKCAYGPAGGATDTIGGIGCSGSGTFRQIVQNGTFNPAVDLGPNGELTRVVNGLNGELFVDESAGLVPFTGVPSQTFNFAPDNFIQRPIERFTAAFMGRYEITDNIEAYVDFNWTKNTTDSQIAFSGTFFRGFSTNCDNPLLAEPTPTGTLADDLGCNTAIETQRLIDPGDPSLGVVMEPVLDGMGNPVLDDMGNPVTQPVWFPLLDGAGNPVLPTQVPFSTGYRNVTGTPRSQFIDNATFRVMTGFRGTLGDNWSWDVFGQYSQNDMVRIATGDLNFSKVQQALFIVDDGAGGLACAPSSSPTAAAGCLPFNIIQFNGVSAEAAAFAQGTGIVTGKTEQKVIGGTIQGDLGPSGFQFPWADSGIQALLGVEYREDRLERVPDDVSQIPAGFGLTGTGGGTLPIEGEIRVYEIFMETQIPLVTDQPFFDELGINGAYRYSNYTTDGNNVENSFDTHTFAAGLTWAPSSEVRLRAQFQRAVRAPNVIELFTGQNTGLFNAQAGANGLFDPCASGSGGTPAPTATAAQCAFTGVTSSQFGFIPDNPAGQLNSVTGGNPFLSPESSDTYTYGIVLQPSFADGLTLAVDYFDITVKDAITTIPPVTTLNQCLASGDPTFCNLIVRDNFGSLFRSNTPPAGSSATFAGVQAVNTNIANFATRGLDIAATYSMDTSFVGLSGWGSVDFNYVSTFLFELSSVPVPGVTTTVECSGLYRGGCGGPNPEYRHRLLTTWQTPWNVDITATWRYYSGVDLNTGQATGGTFTPSGNALDDKLDSANYLDLAAQWYMRENLTLRAGVQNLMGRDPEVSTEAGTAPGNGDTFPGTYDPLGRYIFFGINATF